MSKKLFSLAPLLAIVAFAVTPAVSQAAIPHWFKSGSRQAAGKKVPVMTWGGAVNLSQESPAGEINCKAVGAGYIENPTPGGEAGPAGVGQTQSSNFYECKEPKCETKVKEALGALGYVGNGFAVAYNLPWANELIGTAAPFEEKLGIKANAGVGQSWGLTTAGGSVAVAEGFPARQQAPGGTGGEPKGRSWGATGTKGNAIGAVVGCEIFPNPEGNATLGGVSGQPERVNATEGEIPFEGELHPLIGGSLNNAPNASVPAETEFLGKSSGELEDPLGPGLGGANKGNIKYLGYEAQAPISVNP